MAARKKRPVRKGAVSRGPARKPIAKRGSGSRSGPGARKAGTRKTGARKPSPGRGAAIKVTPLRGRGPEGGDLDGDGLIRINRFLASAGVCSRRAADELVTEGRVSVNGEPITELGTRVHPEDDDVRVDDLRVKQEKPVYLLFNKPKGVVCTNAANEHRRRVLDFLPDVRGRVYTVGRLDAESEGLILVTNDGDFAQRVAHPRYELAKTYAVLIKGRVGDEELDKARGGVWLSEGRTTGARIIVERRGRDRSYLKVSLKEGRNREIRRIFAKLGFPVLSLKRIRIGQLNLHGLGAGRYRFLQRNEVDDLLGLTRKADGGGLDG